MDVHYAKNYGEIHNMVSCKSPIDLDKLIEKMAQTYDKHRKETLAKAQANARLKRKLESAPLPPSKVSILQAKVEIMDDDIQEIKGDIQTTKDDIRDLKGDIVSVNKRIRTVLERIDQQQQPSVLDQSTHSTTTTTHNHIQDQSEHCVFNLQLHLPPKDVMMALLRKPTKLTSQVKAALDEGKDVVTIFTNETILPRDLSRRSTRMRRILERKDLRMSHCVTKKCSCKYCKGQMVNLSWFQEN